MRTNIDVNMSIHEKISAYKAGDGTQNPSKDLDLLQRQYYEVTRAYVDILHILEVGDNLSEEDELLVLKKWREVAQKRRYIKVILQMFMTAEGYEAFSTHGTVMRGAYRYGKTYDPEKVRKYTLRSVGDSSLLPDTLEQIPNWEDKLPTIYIPKSKDEVIRAKWGMGRLPKNLERRLGKKC